MMIVSACLCGECCRYDGKAQPREQIKKLIKKGVAVPACPECLGGLNVPRSPCEIVGGDGADVLAGRAKVINKAGEDVTEQFIRGAEQTLALCRKTGAQCAVLKSKSPSCGSGIIYSGRFDSTLKTGDGVTAALLKQNGIHVYSEEDEYEGQQHHPDDR